MNKVALKLKKICSKQEDCGACPVGNELCYRALRVTVPDEFTDMAELGQILDHIKDNATKKEIVDKIRWEVEVDENN